MKSITVDFSVLMSKLASDCGLDYKTTQYCLTRLRAEGLQFWTITLPKLSKSVLHSLECGVFERPTDFQWKGRSLRYFRSLLDLIFAPDGVLLPEPSAEAIRLLRCFCEYNYKLATGFEPAQLAQAERKYQEIQTQNASYTPDYAWSEKLRVLNENLFRGLLASPDFIMKHGPRFGPGSFAGSKHNRRPFYEYKLLSDKMIGTCNRFSAPYSGYFKPYPSAPVDILVRDEDRVCEVLFVPKDSRGPRVISKEPLLQLKAQMAFFNWCTNILERESRYRINFVSQDTNRELAKNSSVTLKYATLDLKDASDRVTVKLVRRVFRNSPGVSYYLKWLRSTAYRLPSGKKGELHSVAGMGSGLTFPLLAHLVWLTAVQAQLDAGANRDVAIANTFVYGDDLIVLSRYTTQVNHALEKSGLKVNTDKSYVAGHFRESCGGDYYLGKECSPVRLKLQNSGLPRTGVINAAKLRLESTMLDPRQHDNFVVGLVKHTHALRKEWLLKAATYLEGCVERVYKLPWIGQNSSCLGRLTDDTNLILSQGEMRPDLGYATLRVHVIRSVKSRVRDICEYKHLGTHLRKKQPVPKDLYQSLEGSSITAPYGVLSVPRLNKVKLQTVSTLYLL